MIVSWTIILIYCPHIGSTTPSPSELSLDAPPCKPHSHDIIKYRIKVSSLMFIFHLEIIQTIEENSYDGVYVSWPGDIGVRYQTLSPFSGLLKFESFLVFVAAAPSYSKYNKFCNPPPPSCFVFLTVSEEFINKNLGFWYFAEKEHFIRIYITPPNTTALAISHLTFLENYFNVLINRLDT